VPGQERLGCHRKPTPRRAGEEAAQGSQEGTIGGPVGRAPDLASENADLMSQSKELDVLHALGANSEDNELKESADGKVCKRPELASCSVPSHAANGSPAGTASSCSVVQSSFRIARAKVLTEHDAAGRVEVRSAGSEPGTSINPEIAAVLGERRLSADTETPKLLTGTLVETADFVITVGCGETCPVLPGKRYLDWTTSTDASGACSPSSGSTSLPSAAADPGGPWLPRGPALLGTS